MTSSRFLLGALIVVGLACGSRQPLELRLQKIRLAHEIVPVGANTVHSPSGEPVLVVDLRVANQGADHLPHLTVMVRVRGANGVEKAAKRVTLDLSDVRPGVGVQIDASVPGIELGERDEVLVELESNLPAEELRQMPEFQDLLAMTR